ncbi:dTMP kinase [Paenibacillus athensensis]|uniref:Thymidylate kinase n=1 Tax=Paenibacillus athensensis TaxID=1967502 RepID=A0A4Y8PVP5_9BACL|nr:dTMP kinase [Paenibacillus athensensis]MCD1261914.1 dTMP kinase [Paenibacillus athensensis]
MNKGFFISVEGGEGAGKTTLIGRLTAQLAQQGREVITTREPGGIQIAEQIRAIVLDKAHTSMDGRTEALLYAAARRQHLVEKVQPALAAGKIVVCDRFIDSSLAYQGHARGLGIDEVWAINRFAVGDLLPDVTIYLDLDPAVGLQRIQASEEREVNRLDLEAAAFHERVREGFMLLAHRFPERIVTVDARRPADAVAGEVAAILQQRMARQPG